MPKHFRVLGKVSKTIEQIKQFKSLFCILYKFHNSYVVKIGILGVCILCFVFSFSYTKIHISCRSCLSRRSFRSCTSGLYARATKSWGWPTIAHGSFRNFSELPGTLSAVYGGLRKSLEISRVFRKSLKRRSPIYRYGPTVAPKNDSPKGSQK